MRTSTLRTQVKATIALAVATFLTMAPAGAFNFRAPFANNSSHFFYWEGLTTQHQNASEWSRQNNLNPTDMTTGVQSFHGSGSSLADVAAMDEVYPWTDLGRAICDAPVAGDECDHFHVQYNNRYSYSDQRARWLACHEFGHTVGLGHTDNANSCMKDGNVTVTDYSNHDRNHVNGRY